MKQINPSEISARILTLFDESDERIILVSPYMKISKWHKLTKKINELISRGIVIAIYVRDDPENKATFHDLEQLGLEYKKIPHLHCKLYMNERDGIITSMNLLLSSEINSLEIGYATETWAEYNDLFRYFNRYIHTGEPVHSETIAGHPVADPGEFMQFIREELKRNSKNAWSRLAGNVLHISTGRNNYTITINDGFLRINAYLRLSYGKNTKNIQHSLIAKKISDLTTMNVDLQPGLKSDVLHLSAQAKLTLESICINGILQSEAAYLTESIREFIDTTDNLVVQQAFNI